MGNASSPHTINFDLEEDISNINFMLRKNSLFLHLLTNATS